MKHPILGYALRKLVQVPLLLLAVILLLFTIIHLAPGDPIQAYLGDVPAPPGYVEELRASLGLDEPLPVQLGIYVWDVSHGDLGYSLYYRQPVAELIGERLGATLVLMVSAIALAFPIGVLLGVFVGTRPYSRLDSISSIGALAAYSLPVFWLGQLLLLVFALELHWFPTQGMQSLRTPPEGFAVVIDLARHLVLPAIVLASGYMAVYYRLTRRSMLEALRQDYVLTAMAKGVPRRSILFRHALRNALLPVVTVAGLNLGFMISGAAVTEIVFGWPGIGRLIFDSIGRRDLPVVTGVFITVATMVVIVNFLTDVLYGIIDPRVRARQ